MQVDEPEDLEAQLMATKLLMVGAATLSTYMDRLASWLLVAFGAAFALIISNIDDMSNYVKPETIIDAGILFFIAGVVEIIQKFIAAHVATSASASREVEAMMDKLHSGNNTPISGSSFERSLDLVGRSLWPPASWMYQVSRKKSMKGDFTFHGRLNVKLSEIQRYIVLIEAGLLMTAAVKIVSGLGQVPVT